MRGKLISRANPSGFSQLVLTLFLILVYPLLGMIWHHEYPVFSIEVLLLLVGTLVLAGLLSAVLKKYCRSMVVNLVLVSVLTLAFLFHFNLFFLGLVAVMTLGLVCVVLFREKFPSFLMVVMAALIIGSYADSLMDRAGSAPELEASLSQTTRGPVIHILMDSFIGPDGLPQNGESQDLRAEIMEFFELYNFRVHARAYSHYTSTTDSMTRAFNFRNDDENIFKRVYALREGISFRENTWFQELSKMGYPIVVYQSESVDFCHVTPPVVDRCNVFTFPNLKTINTDLDDIPMRAVLLVRVLLAQSTLITKILINHKMASTWGVSIYDKQMLTDLARDVQQSPNNAYFAHVLLPHAPMVHRLDCSLDYESDIRDRFPSGPGWIGNHDESRANRYKRYVLQAKCALQELGILFKTLQDQNLYEKATILVHGDHGTGLWIYKPSVRITNKRLGRDLRETYSVLFAVKYPGGYFSVNNQTTSLNVLMAQTLSEITGKSYEELGISVVSEDKPFIYLTDIVPLQRMDVDIFDRNSPETINSQ